MKTSLLVRSFVLFAGVSALLVAVLSETHLPSGLYAVQAFNAFVGAFILLIAFTDYSNPPVRRTVDPDSSAVPAGIESFPADRTPARLAA